MAMTIPRLVTKKRVTVRCNTPFRIGKTPFAGICEKIVLDVKMISQCLEAKAFVTEILSTGEKIPLDFSNYNTYNGPSDVDDTVSESIAENHQDAEIEIKDNKGNTTEIVNKKVQVNVKKSVPLGEKKTATSTDIANGSVDVEKTDFKQTVAEPKVEIIGDNTNTSNESKYNKQQQYNNNKKK